MVLSKLVRTYFKAKEVNWKFDNGAAHGAMEKTRFVRIAKEVHKEIQND